MTQQLKEIPPKQVNRWQSILTMVLLFLIINTIFSFIFKPVPPTPVTKQTETTKTLVSSSDISPTLLQSLKESKASTTTLKTDSVEITFSNQGAKLISVKTLRYLNNKKQALELVENTDKSGAFDYRISIASGAENELDNAIYQVTKTSAQDISFSYLTAGVYQDTTGQLVKSNIPAGLLITKTFHFENNYQYQTDITVQNTSTKPIFLNQYKPSNATIISDSALAISTGPGMGGNSEKLPIEHGAIVGTKTEKVGPGFFKSLFSGGKGAENIEMLAGAKDGFYLSSRHFLHVIFPQTAISGTIFAEQEHDKSISWVFKPILLNPNDKINQSFSGYMGPKEYDLLKKLNPACVHLIGISPFLGVPFSLWIFQLLKFLYSFLGNYGLAIIVLTILIKILFWPLSDKSFKSMQHMQKLKPEMDKIKEKYKGNPQKINEETMHLYKRYKINPMAGCLPMLLQLPIFFALFSVLQNAIELRGQAFIALPFSLFGQPMWITDLSMKDPTYILPIVMGISMFYQQKMSMPDSNDPQAKMMMWMPVIFTFMFMNFPSGLVLYWLVNNLLTMWQQVYVNKKL